MSVEAASSARPRPRPAGGLVRRLSPFALLFAIVAAVLFFSLLAPGFASAGNLRNLLVNNFALLALVAIAMTLAIHIGGIDLSAATALDMASLSFVAAIAAGYGVPAALGLALGAATAVGLFNAFLIAVIGITPLLATLGTLFIGHSLQQLTTSGGNPIYIPFQSVPAALPLLARGSLAGVPVPVLFTLVVALAVHILLSRTRFGRQSATVGLQPLLALYSGLPVGFALAVSFVLGAVVAGSAGIFVSANVNAYMPFSGNAFLMNAIGAVYVGTTASRLGVPNVLGTLGGVLFFAVLSNGLLMVGWDFYWQQLGLGVAIFLCLAFVYGVRRPTR